MAVERNLVVDTRPALQKSDPAEAYPSPPSSPSQPKSDHLVRQKEQIETIASSPLVLQSTSSPNEQQKPLVVLKVGSLGVKDSVALKAQLGLSQGICGGLTQSKKPCKRLISAKNLESIDLLLKSTASLVGSYNEFDAKWTELIDYVHCYSHDHGSAKHIRIKEWKVLCDQERLIPRPTTVLVREQIREVLGFTSPQCTTLTLRGQRCKLRIGGQKVHNCTRSIAEIVKAQVYLNDLLLEKLLKILEANTYCATHAAKRDPERIIQWKSRIGELVGQHDQTVLRGDGLKYEEPVASQSSTSFWPTTCDTSPFQVLRLWNASDSPDLKSLIESPIGVKERTLGFVYVFEVEGNKGYVKIGYTTRSIEERDAEWMFECNRKPIPLYPRPKSLFKKVPCASRVEQLCHAELVAYRYRILCQGCLKQHIEWFKISPEKAIAVVEKWSNQVAKGLHLSKIPQNREEYDAAESKGAK